MKLAFSAYAFTIGLSLRTLAISADDVCLRDPTSVLCTSHLDKDPSQDAANDAIDMLQRRASAMVKHVREAADHNDTAHGNQSVPNQSRVGSHQNSSLHTRPTLLSRDLKNTTEKKEAVTTSKPSPFRTVIFFSCVALCASIAVFTYLRSLAGSEEDTSDMPARRHSRNDDNLGLRTPSKAQTPKGTGLARRRTIGSEDDYKYTERYWTIEDNVDTMSGFAFVVNMFADLCPPGLLPLAFGLKDTGYIPGLILLLCFYACCVCTMWVIAKTADITAAKDFQGQWAKAIGPSTSWIPVLVVVIVCFGCLLVYSCMFADIFTGVMPAMGLDMSRSLCLLAFTLFPTLPLCLLKNLSALAYSSSFAVLAVLYTTVIMVVRATDGSYAPGGRYFADLDPSMALPEVEVSKSHMTNFGLASLVLINTFAVAFLSHYNGCKYYRELSKHTPGGLVKCTALGMGICVVIFAITMIAGFYTFGRHADGVILKNYSKVDGLINVSRVGMGLSIVASFPLMFSGLREAVISLLKLAFPNNAADYDLVWKQDVLSMGLLMLITSVALVVTDAGLVVGVVGAICGSAIIYIVPCTLYAGAIKNILSLEKQRFDLIWLRCLTALGAVLGIAGCYASLAL